MHNMQKMLPKIIAVVLVVGVVAFYGGMKYGKSKIISVGNFGQGQRGGGQYGGGNGGRMSGGNRGGAGFANGEVSTIDDKSLTLKMRDGSSKIIIFSGSAQVLKSITGTLTDLMVGSQVTVMGNPNSDGSITAQSIQLRPNTPSSTPFGR